MRFVSRDNATGTAANLRRFFAEAAIPREDSVIWNASPWIVHAPGARNRPLRKAEIVAGLATIPPLLTFLPRLRAVILAGRVAALAKPLMETTSLAIPTLLMPHPSPTYVCTSPDIPRRIAATLAEAARLIATPR